MIQLRVRIGAADLALHDFLRLRRGNRLALKERIGAPVEIFADGQLFAIGQLVAIDDHLGVKMLQQVKTKG